MTFDFKKMGKLGLMILTYSVRIALAGLIIWWCIGKVDEWKNFQVFREWNDHEGDNSITLQAYTKVGLALVSPLNFWGIYYNSSLDDNTNWAAYNDALTA